VTPAPQILQVVLLRDGLLVGTEVFVPGQFSVGSANKADLRLEDPSIAARHATLYFKNGRMAIQEGAPETPIFVNGHRVTSCEVRAVDEIVIGPFTLKLRVVSQQKAGQAPDAIRAILQPTPEAFPNSTVVSQRKASQLAKGPVQDQRGAESGAKNGGPPAPSPRDARSSASVPSVTVVPSGEYPPQERLEATSASPKAQASSGAKKRAGPKRHKEIEKIRALETHVAAAAKAVGKRPNIEAAKTAKRSKLFLEIFWGEEQQASQSFSKLKKQTIKAGDRRLDVALLGFGLPDNFVLAEQQNELYRIYVPPKCAVERKASDGLFYPVSPKEFERGSNSAPCLTLGKGHSLRLSKEAM
jgi:hypothetical protein